MKCSADFLRLLKYHQSYGIDECNGLGQGYACLKLIRESQSTSSDVVCIKTEFDKFHLTKDEAGYLIQMHMIEVNGLGLSDNGNSVKLTDIKKGERDGHSPFEDTTPLGLDGKCSPLLAMLEKKDLLNHLNNCEKRLTMFKTCRNTGLSQNRWRWK